MFCLIFLRASFEIFRLIYQMLAGSAYEGLTLGRCSSLDKIYFWDFSIVNVHLTYSTLANAAYRGVTLDRCSSEQYFQVEHNNTLVSWDFLFVELAYPKLANLPVRNLP